MDKILVAAPTCADKDYALSGYIKCYHEFDYKNKSLVLCDNTPDDRQYAESILRHCDHLLHSKPQEGIIKTINDAWLKILWFAGEFGFDIVASIEVDVRCPSNTLTLLKKMLDDNDCEVVSHSVPRTGFRKDFLTTALGCVIFRAEHFVDTYDGESSFEGELYRIPKKLGKRVMQIDNFLELEHRDSRHYNP